MIKRTLPIIFTVYFLLIKTAYGISTEPDFLHKTLTHFTFEDCKKFIGKGGFKSKEELLQIFFNAYFEGSVKNVEMKVDDILALSKAIKTLFPLKNCLSIQSFDSLLIIKFNQPQSVPVPGSFRMATLQMSEHITFILSHSPAQKNLLNFRIADGYVNLRTSSLLRLFIKQMSDMNGTALFYSVDQRFKTSVIGLVEEDTISADKLKSEGTQKRIVIDIYTPQYAGKENIVIDTDELTFLTINFKLRGHDSIMYFNSNEWIKDSLAVSQIRSLINQVQKDFSESRPFPKGIIISKSAIYQLEKRSLSLSTSFHPPQKTENP